MIYNIDETAILVQQIRLHVTTTDATTQVMINGCYHYYNATTPCYHAMLPRHATTPCYHTMLPH